MWSNWPIAYACVCYLILFGLIFTDTLSVTTVLILFGVQIFCICCQVIVDKLVTISILLYHANEKNAGRAPSSRPVSGP